MRSIAQLCLHSGPIRLPSNDPPSSQYTTITIRVSRKPRFPGDISSQLYFVVIARKARVFYQTQTATLCDICEGEDCENVCTTNPETQIGADSEGKGGGYVTSPISSAIYVLTIVYLLIYN